jgi:hypothetical protein
MTGGWGGPSRRIVMALGALVLAIPVGSSAAQAAPQPSPCVRLTVTPPRPALGDRVTLRFELAQPRRVPSTVVFRGSISGPDHRTAPLVVQHFADDPSVFVSQSRVTMVGAWHARVLVFAQDKGGNTSEDPVCYLSKRFTVVRSRPVPGGSAGGDAPTSIVLPLIGVVPIVLGLVLLVMSGQRRARKEDPPIEPATVTEPDAHGGSAGT